MTPETQTIGDCAVSRLEKLLAHVNDDTLAVLEHNDIPTAVVHFNALRNLVQSLQKRLSDLQQHVDGLSYQDLPTMFTNQNVKTIKIDDVGRVTVNVRWSASMGLNKDRGMAWLRSTGNGGLIIETVAAPTLGAFAQAETLAGRPLPGDIFKVTAAQYISITPKG